MAGQNWWCNWACSKWSPARLEIATDSNVAEHPGVAGLYGRANLWLLLCGRWR